MELSPKVVKHPVYFIAICLLVFFFVNFVVGSFVFVLCCYLLITAQNKQTAREKANRQQNTNALIVYYWVHLVQSLKKQTFVSNVK
jgi:hypothetical protein